MRKLKLLLAACALFGVTATTWAQDAGTYYIQNVSNGKWMAPGNSWETQASMLSHADYWKLAINDGVYTLESVVDNKGSHYLSGTYCDAGATNFTITSVDGKEKTYTIATEDGKLVTANGSIIDLSGTDATAEVSQWKFWSEEDMAAGMAAATVENPFDATYLIKDHNLGRNNRDYSSWSNTNATEPKTSDKSDSGASRYSIEAFQKTFDVNQTLSGIPNGVYAVRVNGFYRQDGSDENLPYVYAGDSKTTLPARTGTENNMQAAAVSFEAGNYLSDPAYVQVTDNSLKIGVATTGTSCWVIFKNFHLYYYGDCTVAEVVLADYVKAYNEALAEAQAFTEASMFAEAWTNLQTAISDNTLNLSGVTQEQLETATANLKAANTAATAAVKARTTYDSAVTLINGGTNVDLTSIITNAGFEEGNLNGWTSANCGTPANNTNWSKVGTWYVERWTSNGETQNHLSDGTLTHDVLVLPVGLYTITAKAQNQEQKNEKTGTGFFLYANDEKVEITGTNTYSTTILLSEDKSELIIKFALEGCTGNWVSCDDIHLTYVGEDFPAYTLVTGNMNAEVATAQANADEAFQSNKTVTNYNALIAAIAAAQTSKDAYSKLATVIEKLDAALDAATSSTVDIDAAYGDVKTAYNDGTIADADILTQIKAAYEAVIPVIKSQTASSADFTYAIQNNSFEYGDLTGWTCSSSSDTGVRSTSNETYATSNSDGDFLFNTWWQGVPLTQTVENLPNGQYTLTATVASDGGTIYLIANDEHNDGTATESKTIGLEATFTFLVKEGVATIGSVGSADDGSYLETGHWWYKVDNFRLTKNRDLTDEEKIVPATAEDLQNLNDAIESAEAKTLGFEKDEYAPYNNVEALTALAAAKAIDQTAENLNQATVQEATTALTGATWTANTEEVNAIFDGTFANAENDGAPAGWTMSNNTLGGSYHSRAFVGDSRLSEFNETNSGLFLRFDGTNSNRGSMYYYGNTEGYTMPLKADTYYKVIVDVANWGDKTNKPLRLNVTGPDGFEAKGLTINTLYAADQTENDPQKLEIRFKATVAGNYVINFQCPGADTNAHNVIVSNLELIKLAESEDAINFSNADYATFMAPYDVETPENVKAYNVTGLESNGATLVLEEVNTITANMPVLLFNEGSETALSVNGYDLYPTKAATYINGLLTGVYAETAAPVGSYVLQNQNDVVGFYKVAEGKQPTVGANRAYLNVASSARALYFDGATAIKAIEALTSGEAEIYNAAGARQNGLQKGVNIIKQGGKSIKVMVK